MQLDDIAFLARSSNRVEVLSALVDEPCDRRALRERVSASRVTVGRILTDLEDRGWVRGEGTDYVPTAMGRVVERSFDELRTTLATAAHLGPLLDYLPLDAFDFDLGALADAEVVQPTVSEPSAHVDYLASLFREADDVTMVVRGVSPRTVAANHERVVAGQQTLDAVVTPDVFEAARANEEVAEMVAELFDSDAVRFFERETVPFQFAIYDETTIVSADDEAPQGIVVTDSEAVRDWARETAERLRAGSTPVESFTV